MTATGTPRIARPVARVLARALEIAGMLWMLTCIATLVVTVALGIGVVLWSDQSAAGRDGPGAIRPACSEVGGAAGQRGVSPREHVVRDDLGD